MFDFKAISPYLYVKGQISFLILLPSFTVSLSFFSATLTENINNTKHKSKAKLLPINSSSR